MIFKKKIITHLKLYYVKKNCFTFLIKCTDMDCVQTLTVGCDGNDTNKKMLCYEML